MASSRKIFLFFAIVFVVFLAYASYDIATRTTFPGAKPQLKERILEDFFKKDSLSRDTTGTDTTRRE